MTHIFSLATLMGDEDAARLAEHGVWSLRNCFHDDEYDGWFSAIGHTVIAATNDSATKSASDSASEVSSDSASDSTSELGRDSTSSPASVQPDAGSSMIFVEVVDGQKAAYAHAFVVLAASSATIAGIRGAGELLEQALAVQDNYWWEVEHAKVRESFDREMMTSEAYRGVNANMHTVESYLAAFDATQDEVWLNKAVAILNWVINDQAATNGWRVLEHYDQHWQALADYNKDKPKDPFRPYGYTPGHGLEWARLALHAGAQLARVGKPMPHWMRGGAERLIARAVEDGWDVDGQPGFVYTVGEDGAPVARERMHWVICEALGAVVTLARALEGKDGYEPAAEATEQVQSLHDWAEQWWAYCEQYLIEQPGQWLHELDENNEPSTITWPGKPDAYHVAQMLLLPDLPLAPTFALALQEQRGER